MDPMDVDAATSTGDKKRRVNKRSRDWHKRLHLRKAAARPPAMQSRDKHGPKKTVEELERSGSRKPPRRPPPPPPSGLSDGFNALRFTCSQCGDRTEYAHRDYVRHFEERHRGSPPLFPCHMCPFTTQEFSYLQVHLLSHEDNFSSCGICEDNVKRTWPEFTAHLTTRHCSSGKYVCELCQKFSTGDVNVFLEHILLHNLNLGGADEHLFLRLNDKRLCGPKTSSQNLRCQHCGYEASQKWLITKHVKAVHACQNGGQRRRKEEEEDHSIAVKPNDTIPKMKPRLTRSAVREMCWLTQDCLSLPGREFLDKYCHLSDPQATLEETQQFLMKSVAGDTGDPKWTKALKTVLSNVPQDVNLYAKSENGIVSNASDVTVLTVKNKITVGQNGATYAKRLKMMSSVDKEIVSAESAAGEVNQNDCLSSMIDHTPCPENRPQTDVPVPTLSEPCGSSRMQENRENQDLKPDQIHEERDHRLASPAQGDGLHIACETKQTREKEEKTFNNVLPKIRMPKKRRKRRTRFKKADKKAPSMALKIVLKKNPVEKQWVSQSSLSPSGLDAIGDPHKPQISLTAETLQTVQNLQPTEAQQKKWTKGCKSDLPSEAISSSLQLKPGGAPDESESVSQRSLEGSASGDHGILDDTEKSLQSSETQVDRRRSSGGTSQEHLRAESGTESETGPASARFQTLQRSTDCHMSEEEKGSATDGATPHSSISSSVSQPVITPQGEAAVERACLAAAAQQGDGAAEGTLQDAQVPADSSDSSSSTHTVPAVQQEPPPAASVCHRWRPVPKNLERTLKLVARDSSQLVKHPAGDQPVVVLNHPDVDIPEVARIMEVVNRYRGEVKKVILSRRTLNALSALNGELHESGDADGGDAEPERREENSVQERFVLKMKLRRLNRKKYKIVEARSPSREEDATPAAPAAASKFSCWFCGRIFTSQEAWMSHRRRHLIEWKKPNCENS
ncbi:zinc finger protein 518A-like [Salarias fasciatus]|uniref:Zinc finger protein 518A-like n=1 Tax=Salarias fasciatus TaxID=181472 RepID=A0A672HCR9_SALFA|nr:zinc finger protein 518A-like [Salarias fasciatus]XP_029962833.1 zinc finger protein 518A-like [Salarias fasciatus]